jgi:hypothetical protein
MPEAFNPHPGHPVIDTLLRLHANIGGRLRGASQESFPAAPDIPQ